MLGASLVIFNAGLLLVDHIHFQYNGFMLGVLLCSIGALRQARSSKSLSSEFIWTLVGGSLFAALLVLKHLFLSLAPIYFVHLLFGFCSPRAEVSSFRLLVLGSVVVAVMVFPFVPLVLDQYDVTHAVLQSYSFLDATKDQISRILHRLFPFAEDSGTCSGADHETNSCHARGLVHSYWAGIKNPLFVLLSHLSHRLILLSPQRMLGRFISLRTGH
jgi:alpha-1,3-glucosyltransferase